MRKFLKQDMVCSALATFAALAANSPAAALDIVPTFMGSGWTTSEEAAINAAASDIGSLYSNNAQVNILFQFGSTGLGQSNWGYTTNTYTAYTNLLKADAAANPQNVDLATALANLSKGNNSLGVFSTTAQLRALGVNIGGSFNSSGTFVGVGSGAYDGVITLSNTQPFSFATNGSVTAGQYSALGVSEHEIDEILGGGGTGSGIGFLYNRYYGALDLYRYANGVKSYTNSTNANGVYFSIDGGKTNIVNFNHDGVGDWSDWGPYGSVPNNLIQDAYATAGVTPESFAYGIPEDIMLEAIGYNPAVPEPSTWAMMILGFLGVGLLAYRRKNGAPTFGLTLSLSQQ
jgi:hypothetical protein